MQYSGGIRSDLQWVLKIVEPQLFARDTWIVPLRICQKNLSQISSVDYLLFTSPDMVVNLENSAIIQKSAVTKNAQEMPNEHRVHKRFKRKYEEQAIRYKKYGRNSAKNRIRSSLKGRGTIDIT